MQMMDLLRKIYVLPLAPVSGGADQCVRILSAEFPCAVHEFASGSEVNGWVVPQRWEVQRAAIHRDGELVYDGTRHPLGVMGYSDSFQGETDLETLKKHVYCHQGLPDSLVYYYRHFYRNWERDWGFSIPRSVLDRFQPGRYRVDLVTSHTPGTMKVCDFFVPGQSPETIAFCAHNCHPGQANDDIAGVVVGLEVIKRLAARQNRYSYRLIVGPEQFSSVFYLHSLSPAERSRISHCMYLEMLGHDDVLSLQDSFNGDSLLDRAAQHHLASHFPDHRRGAFRRVIGNDETVWEAPGYEIPTISLSRARPVGEGQPYPWYHSDRDNEEIILPEKLEESVEAVLGILDILERNRTPLRLFEGHLCLSNPKYDLYINAPNDPAYSVTPDAQRRAWFEMLTRLPRSLDGRSSILDIALRHGLPFGPLADYLERFAAKGLIRWLTPEEGR